MGQVAPIEFVLRPAQIGFQKRFHIVFAVAIDWDPDHVCGVSEDSLNELYVQ